MTTNTETVIQAVREERERRGGQEHVPIEWVAILAEKVGEASTSAMEYHFSEMPFISVGRLRRLRKELIQVAAVAVAAVESLDLNELA